jgi:CubicO group peptidase (beta-lactamase class C family)
MPNESLSSSGLQRWRDALLAHVESGRVPGLVALLNRGEDVHVVALGAKHKDKSDPVERETIFRISSLTKPVTAVATLMLIEEARLALDQSIEDLVPELQNRRVLKQLEAPLNETVAAQRAITIRDLLTFRMGFGQLMAKPDAYPILKRANALDIGMGPPAPGKTPRPDEWLRRLGSLPLMRQPGESWHYNTAADVLGIVIARATGRSLGAFFSERIFEPLGMKDTKFYVPAKEEARFVTSYWTDPESGAMSVFDPSQGGQWNRQPVFESGAGGLVSTIDDYFSFARMLMNQGRAGQRQLVSASLIQAMTRNQLTEQQQKDGEVFLDGNGWGFGLGVSTKADGLATVPGQYGWNGGLGSAWRSDPSKQLIGILLTNAAFTSPDPPAVVKDFWNIGYAAV